MEITYAGHSCFRLRSKEITLITDPFDPDKLGIKLSPQRADIVTISHGHSDHNFAKAITGAVSRNEVFLVDRPGEYEVGGVEVRALRTFHDNKEGKERGENLVMAIRIDDIFVVHLGDLGHMLSEKKIEDIGVVDVLMVPIGGEMNLSYKQAGEVISALEPSIVIPMHYKPEQVEEFMKVMSVQMPEKTKKLKVTRELLAENMSVVVMDVS